MNFLAPGALAFALLAVPILLLYMLKLRRREVPVSSAMLWQQLLRDRHSNAPWQKLKRQLLLFLQLLILAGLVLALTRPALPVPSLVSGSALILLDGSASMLATDVPPNRFAAARDAARSAIDNLPENAPVTLILAGIQPRVLASNETDRSTLRRALDSAQADQGAANWPAAFSITASAYTAAANTNAASRPTILIISDGGIPSENLPGLPGEVRYLPIGKSGDNLSITALAVRSSGETTASGAKDQAQIFANVHNQSREPRRAILSFYADDQLIEARQIEVPGSSDNNVVLDQRPKGVQRYTARLSSLEGPHIPLDVFPLDDSAYAVYQPAAGGSVLLATRGNLFLRQLLESLPGLKPSSVVAGEDGKIEVPKSGYDVTILDGIFPAELPSGQLLILNPPENSLFTVSGTGKVTGSVQVAQHALTRFVTWDNVHVLQARQITLPEWATPLVSADSGPLVFAGEVKQGAAIRRVAVVAFDLHDSDLPLQVTFPILVSNLLQYLSPASSLSVAGTSEGAAPGSQSTTDGVAVQPGGSIQIRPAADVREIEVKGPDRQIYRLQPEEGKALFNQTGSPGIYTVTYPGHPELGSDSFAVNLFSPRESAIQPRETVQIGQTSLEPSAKAALGQRELWPWAAWLALMVLLLEWGIYQIQRQVNPFASLLRWFRKGA